MDIISGIYKIENIKNNKVYIGSSKNIYRRWSEHRRDLKNGCHHSASLQRSYNIVKDESSFEYSIIETISDEAQLKIKEQYWIDKYNSFNKGYNCCSLVDNPKYTKKNLKKAEVKKQTDIAYEEFWNIYNSLINDNFKIGKTFKTRLELKHYKLRAIKQLIFILQWFIENHDMNIHISNISYINNVPYIYIHNLKEPDGKPTRYKVEK